VIEFVADVRSRSAAVAEGIDPGAAERLIRSVLDDEETDLSASELGGVMIVLLADPVVGGWDDRDLLDVAAAGVPTRPPRRDPCPGPC
jgi:hypothetical protein